MKRHLLILALSASGCHSRREESDGPLSGPASDAIPLYRPWEDGPRVYVEADLGDGVPRFFLVDTGSAVSTLSKSVAAELELELRERDGWLEGVAGRSPWVQGTVPEMQLGRFSLQDVDFAVNVTGVPSSAGAVPVAGLLGNNVWQRFALALDYPGGVLELARPGQMHVPPEAIPMSFDGQHVSVAATLEIPHQGDVIEQPLIIKVDTGAGGLLLSGPAAKSLEPVASAGVEPIFGVGSGEDLPLSNFLRTTHRVPVAAVRVGGVRVAEEATATWLPESESGLANLLGHTVLDGYRVLMDYPGQRFALTPSVRPPKQPDLRDRYLSWLKRQRDPALQLTRAEVLMWKGDLDEAEEILLRRNVLVPEDARAAALLSRLLRQKGEHAAALAVLQRQPVERLVAEGEILALVNGLWLSGKPGQALAVAQEAVKAAPDEPQAWLALADAARASRDFPTAHDALRRAIELEQNPDGHLLRRAWLAADEGDHYGALTHVRRLMDLYPSGAVAPWFYALEVSESTEISMFLEDLQRARDRLHPGDGPLDFFAGAYQAVGEEEIARRLMEEGQRRDCDQALDEASRINCLAWYQALARHDLDTAYALIQRAIEEQPYRSEFLDTLAAVQEARGELRSARDAAWSAASMEPDDVYLLWQAARLQQAASGSGS